jgi:hypothetical protein
MKAVEAMTQAEIAVELIDAEGKFTSADYDQLENNLILRAYVLGWTGDPLQKPAEAVLAAVRQTLREKPAHNL